MPLGWVDPEEVGLEVIKQALPTTPGMYWRGVTDPEGQAHMGKWHTDGREFHYLNAGGLWVDVGWGQPSPGDTLNGPLYEQHGSI